jgi:hypothetical protein
MSKYIDLRLFLISLAVGVLLVYVYQPTPTIIYVYPTPDNVDKLLFKDKAENCFRFEANEVKCPTDASQISTVPVQEHKNSL